MLLGGDSGGTFRPDAPITRGAASAIATRLADSSLRKSFTLYRTEQTARSLAGGTLTERTAVIGNGDRVIFGSLTGAAASGAAVAEFTVSGGTLRAYNNGGWEQAELGAGGEGIYSGTMFVLDAADGTSYMAYAPQSWELLQNGSRRYLEDENGVLRVTRSTDGFTVSLLAGRAPAGVHADYAVVMACARLIDWDRANSAALWGGYTNSGSGRWCFDGYYWPSPTTYVPSGENVYYQMQAAYLCRSFLALTNYDRLAYDLALCTVDVMIDRQNSHGFFPTTAGSTWLSGDYGIGPGFYDTRFNTDLVEMILDAAEIYGLPRFAESLERYIAFYRDYSAAHHTTTRSGGWLVWDYYNPSGGRQTHTSLNHQLAEALLLYHLSDWSGDASLAALGDQMVLAIEDTEEQWVRYDSNLHYAVYPDGSYGGTDYPYLTYNDLSAVQEYLEDTRGTRNASFDRLMYCKKVWMDANGVTEYKK